MTINLNFKSMLAATLLSGFGSFAAASTQENLGESERSDPKATAAEVNMSFRDIPYLDKAFINTAPIDRKDSLVVGKLGVDAGNKDMILKLAQEIANDNENKFDSLLIAHKGKFLFESYYSRGRIDLPHFQASATKAYTSLALGRAIQLGYLTMADLNKPLVSFLKDLDPTKFVDGAEKINLNQALTMRGGLRLSKEQKEEFKLNPALFKGQKQVQTLLERSAPITPESQNFLYGNYNPSLVMQVIDAVVPGTAKDFIRNELLNKMGITNYRWRTAVSGLPESGWRVSMTSRDMLKIGTLAINKGKWNGEQLIPKAFISKATSSILYTGDDDVYGGGKDVSNQGYGYFWWSAVLKYANKNYFSSSAQGGGGQYIILVEELDLVVVVTAHNNDNRTLQVLAERILPAFIQNSKPTMSRISENQDEFPILEGPYLGQKPPSMVAEPFAPGIISKAGWELEGVFAPGMKEFYYTTDNGKDTPIIVKGFRQQNNVWKQYIEFKRKGEITFSPDGKRMHMAKGYKDRIGDDWSERKSLGPMFDRKDWGIMRLSASAKGTYVFDDYKNKDTIRISTIKNGERQAPKKMSSVVNSGKWTAHPFIAPDESYLIWDSEREGGYGASDLYVSFRQKDGSWGSAINMGDKVNSKKGDTYASVTPDGNYMLFNRKIDESGNTDIYWIDAKIIEMLRPKL